MSKKTNHHNNRIIGLSLTHNDYSKGWLKEWFLTNSKYLDRWIIVDDFSSDNTYEELIKLERENQNKCIIDLYQTPKPLFKTNENKIRSLLWEQLEGITRKGDWIIVLDSDEQLTKEFENINNFLNEEEIVLIFKKLEIWNANNQYRTDGLWSNFFERMFPYKNRNFGHKDEGFHFPQIPKYTLNYKRINTNIPILHLGYNEEKNRINKLNFMINNKQQKQDITYYNLLTINKTPKLKDTKDYKKSIVSNIIIDLDNCYYIDKTTMRVLEKYKEATKWVILRKNSNYQSIKQLEFLDKTYFFNEWEKDHFKEILKGINTIDKTNYLCYLKPSNDFNKKTFDIAFALDKEIILDRDSSFILITNDLINHIKNLGFVNNINEILKFFEDREYIWVVEENFNPFPYNCDNLIKTFKNINYYNN